MGARSKLNAAYVNGAIIIASVLGFALQSWAIFFLVLIVGLAGSLGSGNIRMRGKRG